MTLTTSVEASDRGTGSVDGDPAVEGTMSRPAPELGLLFAERAIASADGGADVLQAQLTRVAILNRLGRGVDAATHAAPALHRAEREGAVELGHALRVELARCALDAGPAATALAVLRPVLEHPAVPPAALVVAAEALAACGRTEAATEALDAVDGRRSDLSPGAALLLQGTIRVARARQHRRAGSATAAESDARAGLEVLDGLGAADQHGCEVHGHLVLELVLALLDRGAADDAARVAALLLDRPARAATADPAAWTALALATRVHLPAGHHERALRLLTEAVRVAERHRLDAVLVGCHDALAQLHEERGELGDAVRQLRSARAAEHRRRRGVETVRAVVEEIVAPRPERVDAPEQVAALIRLIRTGPLGGTDGTPSPDPAPDGAPEPSAHDEPKETAEDAVDEPVTEEPEETPESDHARHRRTGDRLVTVAELLSAASVATPRPGGRRRAEDRNLDDSPSLVCEPPRGSELVLSGNHASQDQPEDGWPAPDAGLGDLLAEALAAFHEGRRSRQVDGSAVGDAPDTNPEPTDPDPAETDPEPAPEPTTEVAAEAWQPPEPGRRAATGQ